MSFSAGQTGFERGATQLVLDYSPVVVDRWKDDGPPRAQAIGLTGAPIVVEYVEAQNQPYWYLRVIYLSEAQLATFLTLMRATGPLQVKANPSGTASVTCAVVSYAIEPAFRADFAEDLDTNVRGYRADVQLALL
jgi:hypothetical protein